MYHTQEDHQDRIFTAKICPTLLIASSLHTQDRCDTTLVPAPQTATISGHVKWKGRLQNSRTAPAPSAEMLELILFLK
jgi:hypothetical protein